MNTDRELKVIEGFYKICDSVINSVNSTREAIINLNEEILRKFNGGNLHQLYSTTTDVTSYLRGASEQLAELQSVILEWEKNIKENESREE